MGLFSRKDWNVIAVLFERKGLFQINGNRGKGGEAVKIRDGVKKHSRVVFWAVFDQKGAFLEGEPGHGRDLVPPETLNKLSRELPRLKQVQTVLSKLAKGETDKLAVAMEWSD